MDKTPLVSVLMNSFNSERYLEQTLESLLLQTYRHWELVFIDNCSTDGSSQMARQLMDGRLRLIRTPEHVPLGEAREFGLQQCNGAYICILDTDDLWDPLKLEIQLDSMRQHPDALLAYSGFTIIDENGREQKKWPLQDQYGQLLGRNLSHYEVNIQTIMFKRELLDILEGKVFDPSLHYAEDFNMVMRSLAAGPALCIGQALVYYRKHQNSLSAKTMHLWGPEMAYTYRLLDEGGHLDARCTDKQKKECLAKINYYYARHFVKNGELSKAREVLHEYRFLNYRYLGLFVLAYIPILWEAVHRNR